MVLAPGHAHLHAIKILHLDKFLASRQIIPRHCASAHLSDFATETTFRPLSWPFTATAPACNKLCTWTAKTRAIPSLHRDSFLAKVPGLCPVLSSGNTTSPYCRAVRLSKNLSSLLITLRLVILQITPGFVS